MSRKLRFFLKKITLEIDYFWKFCSITKDAAKNFDYSLHQFKSNNIEYHDSISDSIDLLNYHYNLVYISLYCRYYNGVTSDDKYNLSTNEFIYTQYMFIERLKN